MPQPFLLFCICIPIIFPSDLRRAKKQFVIYPDLMGKQYKRLKGSTMVILAIGDVVGSGGCEFLRSHLPSLKKLHGIDLVIANGENSADGNGITPYSAEYLFTSGVDVITSGNHVFRRKEILSYLEDHQRLLRPANYPSCTPGNGFCLIDTGRAAVCVINLIGTVFMDSYDSPFLAADAILKQIGPNMITIVDFHAEATSEKRSLAFYLDGRITALFGTHTHVQTADEEILPGKTAYLTDVGMTGSCLSVLGVDPQLTIQRFLTKMPVKFVNGKAPYFMSGVIFDIDNKSRTVNSVNRLQIK
jgi:metallophosphoesterase (TIGR00282 family)